LSRVDITIMRDSTFNHPLISLGGPVSGTVCSTPTAPIRSSRSGYRMLRSSINKSRVMKRQFALGLNAGVLVPEIR